MPSLKISVVIPVFNCAEYLQECLDSILSQSFENYEIICVNDGSTDASLQILNDYAFSDKRLRVYSQENSGVSIARKNGLSHCTGDYIWFVDADDKLADNALKKLAEVASLHLPDIVFMKAFVMDGEKMDFHHVTEISFKERNSDVISPYFTAQEYHNIVFESVPALWTKLLSRDLLERHDDWYFPAKFGGVEDLLLNCQMTLRAEKIAFCDDYLYCYRLSNQNSLMHRLASSERVFEIFDTVGDVKNFLLKEGFFDDFAGDFLLFAVSHIKCWYSETKGELRGRFFRKMLSLFNDLYPIYTQLPGSGRVLRYDNHLFYRTVLKTSSADMMDKKMKGPVYYLQKQFYKFFKNF